jgi:DNA-binding response OmpR family regulator
MALILVIEDDRVQRVLTAGALKAAGHEVLEAVDGETGLQAARLGRPDLILCDVMMPGMNGYEIVTALRKEDPAIADTPVIMLTALNQRAHMRIGMVSGADDYLTKPFTMQELMEAVTALLARRQAQRDAIVSQMKSEIVEVLDEQKQELARQYERRFMEELSARWDRGQLANSELKYADATVLVVDLFGALRQQLAGASHAGETVRRAYHSARDNLYLFRARHLLSYGDDLLSIFVDEETGGADAKLRAVRAAFALQKALAALVPPAGAGTAGGEFTVALHEGPVTLLHVSDPLHGDADATLATGDAVAAVRALRAQAQRAGWRVSCSREVLAGLEGLIRTGAQAPAAGHAFDAIELLGVT